MAFARGRGAAFKSGDNYSLCALPYSAACGGGLLSDDAPDELSAVDHRRFFSIIYTQKVPP